jgi:glycosyltransferase involved in cell wall biosynthesis
MSGEPKTRVLFVTHNTKYGGAEVALARILELVDRRAIDVHVAQPDEGPLCERLRALPGTQVHVVEASRRLTTLKKRGGGVNLAGWLAAPWHLGLLVQRLARLISSSSIDVVFCSSIKADFYAAAAARLARRPCVWYIHDYVDAIYFPRWLLQALRLVGGRVPVAVLVNSKAGAEALARLGIPRERLRVVYYPPHASAAAAPSVRQELELPPASRLVTMVGRLTPPKGQREFVEAAARLVDRFPDVTFLIVGDSLFGAYDEEYRDRLVERLKAPELRGRVRWLGARPAAAAIQAQSDVAVMNSLGPEGFGLVAAEAMWAGVPVVGTALGGTTDLLIDGETGTVVEPGRVEALADAIALVLTDRERGRRLAEAARRHVATVQSEENVRRLEQLLREASARRGAA